MTQLDTMIGFSISILYRDFPRFLRTLAIYLYTVHFRGQRHAGGVLNAVVSHEAEELIGNDQEGHLY
jgi:hypothetical protein